MPQSSQSRLHHFDRRMLKTLQVTMRSILCISKCNIFFNYCSGVFASIYYMFCIVKSRAHVHMSHGICVALKIIYVQHFNRTKGTGPNKQKTQNVPMITNISLSILPAVYSCEEVLAVNKFQLFLYLCFFLVLFLHSYTSTSRPRARHTPGASGGCGGCSASRWSGSGCGDGGCDGCCDDACGTGAPRRR